MQWYFPLIKHPSELMPFYNCIVLYISRKHGIHAFQERPIILYIYIFRYSLVIEDGTIQSIMTEPNHTGLACLLCIKNFSKGKFVNTEHLSSR